MVEIVNNPPCRIDKIRSCILIRGQSMEFHSFIFLNSSIDINILADCFLFLRNLEIILKKIRNAFSNSLRIGLNLDV